MICTVSHGQLHQLIQETCQHPPKSLERQVGLTRIIRLIIQSDKLWQENTPYYEDALQQTWLYLCRNLCEANTGNAYDPEISQVTTWLNNYLKRRLLDHRIALQREKKQHQSLQQISSLAIETAPPIPPILEKVKQWVINDPNNELKHHIRGYPHITCKILILRRLPPRKTWEELSAEFNIPPTTLSSFYRRHCFPKLRKFGESQGYL